jgi:hypothetical protein
MKFGLAFNALIAVFAIAIGCIDNNPKWLISGAILLGATNIAVVIHQKTTV